MDKKYKGVLAIDFDNTIAHSIYPTILGRVKGAKKYINKLIEDGWYVIIWTCRCDDNVEVKPFTMAKKWLDDNGINYHKMNEHNEQLIITYGNDTRKIAADYYIDDKNIFGLKSWKRIYTYLSNIDGSQSCLRYCEEAIIDE